MVLVGVGAGVVKEEWIGGDFGEEVGAVVERLDGKAFVFDEAVEGFHNALVGVGRWGDRAMGRMRMVLDPLGERAGALLKPETDELAAVVGLDRNGMRSHPADLQVAEDAVGKRRGTGEGTLLSIGQEGQAADHVAGGVLATRQAEAGHGGPIVGDIEQIFGIYIELLEQPPLLLDGPQVVLDAVLAAPGADELVLTTDAGDGLGGAGQRDVSLQTLCAPRGQAALQGEDGGLRLGRDARGPPQTPDTAQGIPCPFRVPLSLRFALDLDLVFKIVFQSFPLGW